MNKDFFEFENRKLDFPFYNNNPKISKSAWFVLFAAVIIGLFFLTIPYIGPVVMCSVLLLPVLYYLNWDYKRIFQKPSLNDLGWAVLMAILYLIYAIIMEYVMISFGINAAETYVDEPFIYSLFTLIFQLMGEEVFKLILFVFFLFVVYKYTNNRKISIIISLFITLFLFGEIHGIDDSFLPAFIIQGLGSVVHMFLYIKTKNLAVSYISHLLTDIIALIMF